MKIRAILVVLVLGAMLGGCDSGIQWVIRPMSADKKLKETVLRADAGLFVTDKILVLDVDGMLFNQRRKGLFAPTENPVAVWVEKLDKAQADSDIKAVVLRINSPGGGVTASDIMYRRLKDFRSKRPIPVIAIIEDVGASGAYYLACGADEIMAHPSSVTGSIGVMVQTISFAGTMSMLRIDARAVTSGPRKDMASPFKPLDPKDLAILQAMVDEFYEQFLKIVGESRSELTAETIRRLADGRVFTGSQAKANGLVDRLGYVWDAIDLAKEKTGSKRVKVVMYHRPLGHRSNAYSAGPPPPANAQVNLINISAGDLLVSAQPKFLYLWTGHTNR